MIRVPRWPGEFKRLESHREALTLRTEQKKLQTGGRVNRPRRSLVSQERQIDSLGTEWGPMWHLL